MKKNLRRFLLKLLINTKSFKFRESIIIFSEKRSGSTWLFEMLNNHQGCVPQFEPLNGSGPFSLQFNYWPKFEFKRNVSENSQLIIFKKLLEFKLYSSYTTQFCRIRDIMFGKFVLTKFVGLGDFPIWILENFKFKKTPIFLIRNPIDVSVSQLKTFEKYYKESDQEEIIRQLSLLKNIDPNSFHHFKSRLERQIIIFFLRNVDVLKCSITRSKSILIYYENIILNPQKELSKIFKEHNTSDQDICAILNHNFEFPSRSDFNKEYKLNKQDQLLKNYHSLNDVEKQSIQAIYDFFNFDLYSSKSPFPINDRNKE